MWWVLEYVRCRHVYTYHPCQGKHIRLTAGKKFHLRDLEAWPRADVCVIVHRATLGGKVEGEGG